MTYLHRLILIALITLFSPNLGLSDTKMLSIYDDFYKTDSKNAFYSNTDDGEINLNYTMETDGTTLSATALPKELYNHASAIFAKTIVVAGGFDLSTYSKKVYLNTISNGNLESWREGPDLPAGIRNHKLRKRGNYIYCFGGRIASGLSTTIYRAQIDYTNKTLLNWETAGSMPEALEKYSLIEHRGFIFILGGSNGLASNKVYRASINYSNNISNWLEVSPMPNSLYDHSSIVFNNAIWLIGGNTGSTDVNHIYSTTIESTGSLSGWTLKSNYPKPISKHQILTSSAGIVLIGGSSSGTEQTDIYRSCISVEPNTSKWHTSQLSEAILDHSVERFNEYAFIIGGKSSDNPQKTVKKIVLNTFPTWHQSNAMTDIKKGSDISIGIHDHIYYSGGRDITNSFTNHIYKSTYIEKGGVNIWSLTATLPAALAIHSSANYNNRLYILGGYVDTSGNTTDAVYYSNQISFTGTISTWTSTTALPEPMVNHRSVAYNDRLYVFKGNSVYANSINGDGSLSPSWTQLNDLPGQIEDYSCYPIVYGNKLFIVIESPEYKIYSATIESNGTLTNWINVCSPPISPISALFIENNVLYIANKDPNVVFGTINSNGQVTDWTYFDQPSAINSMFVSMHVKDGIVNVFGSDMYPIYTDNFKYKSTFLFSDIQLDGLRNIQSLGWSSNISNDLLNVCYRTSDGNQWSTWNEVTNVTSNSIPVNAVAESIEIGFDIDIRYQNDYSLTDLSIQYNNFIPTPTVTPVVIPNGFDGKIISKKTTYVYPNPSRGNITKFKIYTLEQADVTFKIYSTTNRIVYEDSFQTSVGYNNFQWNNTNIANGVYLYIVEATGKTSGIKERILKRVAIIK